MRSIDYGSGTLRDEVVLSRAEPLGGGGYQQQSSRVGKPQTKAGLVVGHPVAESRAQRLQKK